VMSRLHRARKILQGQLQELAIKKGIIKPKVEQLPSPEQRSQGGTRYGT
jgi:hypothetical protein